MGIGHHCIEVNLALVYQLLIIPMLRPQTTSELLLRVIVYRYLLCDTDEVKFH